MPIPLFEIKLSKSPIAIIKTGDRQLAFIKIKKFDVKYFAVKDLGIYELDDDYEYRYKNTSIYLYNYSKTVFESESIVSFAPRSKVFFLYCQKPRRKS
mgnify:CR=1 FL=1